MPDKKVNCDKCDHINTTEKYQDWVYAHKGIRPVHVCQLFNKQLFHHQGNVNDHPLIHPCTLCGGKHFKPLQIIPSEEAFRRGLTEG